MTRKKTCFDRLIKPGAVLTLVAVFAAPEFTTGHPHQARLTGLTVFSTNSSGDPRGAQVWSTHEGRGSTLGVFRKVRRFLTPVTASRAGGVEEPLSVGTHHFRLFGEPGRIEGYFGLKLFFDHSPAPQISVFAPTDTSPTGSDPPFWANPQKSADLPTGTASDSTPDPGSPGSLQVRVLDYRWSIPGVEPSDRVSKQSLEPNGREDFVGVLTLQVSPIPQPSDIALLLKSLLLPLPLLIPFFLLAAHTLRGRLTLLRP